VTAATLSGWRDAFLAAGEASLATRPTDGQVLESDRLKARLGEMLLERELLSEPRRFSRRLRLLRGWSHGNQEDSEELLA
jgi:hypothetical protein